MTPLSSATEWLIRFDNFIDEPKWHNIQLIIDYVSYKTLKLSAAEDVLTTNKIVEYTHAGALSKKSATERKMLWFREEPVKLINNLKDVPFDAMEFQTFKVEISRNAVDVEAGQEDQERITALIDLLNWTKYELFEKY